MSTHIPPPTCTCMCNMHIHVHSECYHSFIMHHKRKTLREPRAHPGLAYLPIAGQHQLCNTAARKGSLGEQSLKGLVTILPYVHPDMRLVAPCLRLMYQKVQGPCTALRIL